MIHFNYRFIISFNIHFILLCGAVPWCSIDYSLVLMSRSQLSSIVFKGKGYFFHIYKVWAKVFILQLELFIWISRVWADLDGGLEEIVHSVFKHLLVARFGYLFLYECCSTLLYESCSFSNCFAVVGSFKDGLILLAKL